MRLIVSLVSVVACGATVEGNNVSGIDAPAFDSAPPIDAPSLDAPARLCAGGDTRASAADGSCLVFFNQPKSFADASAACIVFGSKLAVLTDANRDSVARGLSGALNVFVGLSDTVQEGTFVWADGTPLAFSNFNTGEPNDANGVFPEDCIILNGAKNGKWDDRPCAPNAATTVPGVYPYLCMF
ncbi:MAG: C-type lectin domain-containing protein [Kofleriaceae bacterium]